jgi:hypothetical protein
LGRLPVRVRSRAREPGSRERDCATGDQPGLHLQLEPAGLHGGISLCQLADLLGFALEDADPAEPPSRLPEERARCEQVTRRLELGEMVQVRVLQRRGGVLAELWRVRRREEEDDGVSVELHATMLEVSDQQYFPK